MLLFQSKILILDCLFVFVIGTEVKKTEEVFILFFFVSDDSLFF